ncbi:MAG: metal-sulfur cluster assembly factor [Saprospiraceae bacterium]|nr:MAG: putative metal-sulfur cluster biosynthetic enzyme [Bacteroidetes bacterium OLB9]MCO6463386.1 metal-sulfur cluster assembly factor [Saprospiraceae bacterium]MCZ2338461.1 metal-sulfur cluster assembly factor [Chitinophagales bacterium]
MSANSVLTNNQEKCDYALVGLYYVDDPEVGLNVVDLGLIYELEFDEDNKILNVTMTLTTQFCPMGESITSDVTESLTHAFPDWTININLVFDPPWDFSMISPEGKVFLGH